MSDPYIEALVERVAIRLAWARAGLAGSATSEWPAWVGVNVRCVYRRDARAALSAVLDGIREPDLEMTGAAVLVAWQPDNVAETFTRQIDNLRQRNG
jgi:hypothetical protein